jgi:hypothetical protein
VQSASQKYDPLRNSFSAQNLSYGLKESSATLDELPEWWSSFITCRYLAICRQALTLRPANPTNENQN